MHAEAYSYVRRSLARLDPQPRSVVEIGARDVSGPKIRDLFGDADSYVGIDPSPGAGVDVVASGVSWQPDDPVDLVVCCEVAEHTPLWPDIVANAYEMLVSGGALVVTCAGPGRPEHGVNIDDPDRPGWYANVDVDEMRSAFVSAGFVRVEVENAPSYAGTDTYAIGWRP